MNIRTMYEQLIMMESMKDLVINPVSYEEHLKNLKQRIRAYHKEEDKHIVVNRDYGYIELVSLPDKIKDKETAREYFEAYEVIELHYAYDCTGKLFTVWYKLVQRNGRWYAYHCVGVDV